MSFVTIYINPKIGETPTVLHEFRLPSMTRVGYAALEIAEDLGVDQDEMRYSLVDPVTMQIVPSDDLLTHYDRCTFGLGWRPREIYGA